MTIEQAIKQASNSLKSITQRPTLEAEILLSNLLNIERISLHARFNNTFDKQDEFDAIVKKRVTNYPLEYITKNVGFYGFDFFICEGVLIPRSDTELLVDVVLSKLKNIQNATIAEIGTGSGIISIMLSKMANPKKIIATDLNMLAIDVANKNIAKHGCKNINLLKTNYLDGVYEKIDFLVSNPPYIKNGFDLDPNVRYEPDLALFGGENGDEILHHIIKLSYEKKIKYLACEHGYDQKTSLENYLKRFNTITTEFYKDTSGHDRVFFVEFDL